MQAKLARCGAWLLAAAMGSALAQGSYPAKPVRLVTASPGTGIEVGTRIIAVKLADRLGQPVVVDPRGGGAAAVAASVVAAAAPDGYTLLSFPNQITINPWTIRNLSYDPVKDFTPIARVGYLLQSISVNAASPLRSMQDLIAAAKAKPDALRYATPGIATPHHLAMEQLGKATGIRMEHIPYKGAPVVVTDLMANRFDVGVTGVTSVMSPAAAGKLRILAVMAKERFKPLPDVPATGEVGVDIESPWMGVLGPRGVPQEIAARLSKELLAVLAEPDVQQELAKLGTTVAPSGATEFATQIKSDTERWRKVVDDLGIQPQ